MFTCEERESRCRVRACSGAGPVNQGRNQLSGPDRQAGTLMLSSSKEPWKAGRQVPGFATTAQWPQKKLRVQVEHAAGWAAPSSGLRATDARGRWDGMGWNGSHVSASRGHLSRSLAGRDDCGGAVRCGRGLEGGNGAADERDTDRGGRREKTNDGPMLRCCDAATGCSFPPVARARSRCSTTYLVGPAAAGAVDGDEASRASLSPADVRSAMPGLRHQGRQARDSASGWAGAHETTAGRSDGRRRRRLREGWRARRGEAISRDDAYEVEDRQYLDGVDGRDPSRF